MTSESARIQPQAEPTRCGTIGTYVGLRPWFYVQTIRWGPYAREHIRRFGWYFLEKEQLPEPLKPRSLQLAAFGWLYAMTTFCAYPEPAPLWATSCLVPMMPLTRNFTQLGNGSIKHSKAV